MKEGLLETFLCLLRICRLLERKDGKKERWLGLFYGWNIVFKMRLNFMQASKPGDDLSH